MSRIDDTNAEIFFRVRNELDFFTEEFASEFVKRVRDRTPVDTGRLKAGWDVGETSDSVVVTNDVEYATYVENGTPHMFGAHMLATTFSERESISQVAMRRAKSRAGVK